ncbi:MAG: hypothetical protein ACYC6V_00815 [Bacillota bacterium]
MSFSPVIGLTAEEAREELRRTGTPVIEEMVTRPPWPGAPEGALRVIAVRVAAGGVVLVMAHEGYHRAAPIEGGHRRA